MPELEQGHVSVIVRTRILFDKKQVKSLAGLKRGFYYFRINTKTGTKEEILILTNPYKYPDKDSLLYGEWVARCVVVEGKEETKKLLYCADCNLVPYLMGFWNAYTYLVPSKRKPKDERYFLKKKIVFIL